MRRFLLLCAVSISLACGDALRAQNTKWNNAPGTGFVFQITNNEAERLLTKSGSDTIIHSLLHTGIDTFDVNKGWISRPDKGHFILVRIIGNKLHCEYTSVFPYQVLLLKEYNALTLQVLDLDGNVRGDAKVKLKARRIRFDRQSMTYRIENDWFGGLSKTVTVELDGFRSVFNIEKKDVPSWSNDYHTDDGPDFYSYMITDKNKYRPGERARFKSYALTGSRRPIRRDLELWLLNGERPIQLGTVSPHRPGSFVGEVHLHDSLKLVLDRVYSLQLWEKNGRVVSNCAFRYEDYELNGNEIQIEIASPTHFHPASNYFTISATTENGLRLKDARATVTILTRDIREIFQPLIILPDTLMAKELSLDPDGPTAVEIPSRIFDKSNTSYYVDVSVVNSQKQRMERSLTASHYFSRYELTATYSNDSIVYRVLDNGVPLNDLPAKIFYDNAVEGRDIILPYKEKINPTRSLITVHTDRVSRTIRLAGMLPKFRIKGGIQKDSFNISVENPQAIQVSWFIYQGSNLLQKGFGTEIAFKSRIEDRSETYYVELLYSFAGSDHITSRNFEFREASLDIALHVPDKVYPGLKVDALVEVTDDEGNAVSGVDLTALATTAKLDYHLPVLPYYGSTSYARSEAATYMKHELRKRSAILDLDYNRWASRARLDTMKYYQFAYPDRRFFFHQEDIADSTQFAVFVMENGMAKEIFVIEVDQRPVFYAWTNQPAGYSFYVEPGKPKKVTLRLFDRVLILDSMSFEAGKKTIFSIDLNELPEGVSVHKIAPVTVKKGKRTRRTLWQFTQTEVNRHLTYLAGFTETKRPAYLSRGNYFVPVSAGGTRYNQLVVGPVVPGLLTYTELDGVTTTYKHDGGFSYGFDDNVVYKTQPPKLMPDQLLNTRYDPMVRVNDTAINKTILFQREGYFREMWHPRTIDLVDRTCRVRIQLPYEEAQTGVASILFQNCKTQIVESPCRSYSRQGSDYFTVPRGCHHTIVLYNNGSYLKMDSVQFHSYTNVVIDMKTARLNPADSASMVWLAGERGDCFRDAKFTTSRTLSLTHPRYNIGNVRGTVLDEMNNPLPGASIVLKGTMIGTVSDINGRFMLDIPEDPSTLEVNFIGFQKIEIEITVGSEISVVMVPDIQQLQEIVVVGYGVSTRHSLTGALSTSLQGRVAGVVVTSVEEDYQTGEVDIRNVREAEQRLYEELLTLNRIRSDFSDVGFWEPRLFTDGRGQARFSVTFPDDITRWDAVIYGMNPRLQTGTVRKEIRSYKPIMAELHVPQFLTVGDSGDFLGKVLNFTSDSTIAGRTAWKGFVTLERALVLNSHHSEKYPVAAISCDTITTSYSFTGDDGYFDGEERKVPVIKQGTIRASGSLSILGEDALVRVKAGQGEEREVQILENQLDVYAQDVRYLLHYKYDCNEQLASKLIGLLNHKLIATYEGKLFRYDKDVNRIVRRLLRNQNNEFLWSWWDISPATSYWMSAHILRALRAAKDAGYQVELDVANITRKATYQYDFLDKVSPADIDLLHALAMWDARIDYAKYVRRLEKQIQFEDSVSRAHWLRPSSGGFSRMHEKLLLLEVRQIQNLPFHRDSLLRYRKQTVLNEVYFGDEFPFRHWYTNDLTANVIAYRIVRRDSTLSHLRSPMQMWFLSQRRRGAWNTYEASNIMMGILPDLTALGSTRKAPATVALSGKVNERITQFPFRMELAEGDEIHVRKERGATLYLMEYTEERVTKARTASDAFRIETSFGDSLLKAGEPVILKATVEVKQSAGAEHVMIELPIPAGCSYAEKKQFGNRIETHREYFKDRTVIFCEDMTPGTYVFQVELLPRFTGKYYVIPAQVSLMYFPVVNANTNLHQVTIK